MQQNWLERKAILCNVVYFKRPMTAARFLFSHILQLYTMPAIFEFDLVRFKYSSTGFGWLCQAYRATSSLVWEPPPQSNGDFSFKRLISIRFLPQSQPSLLGGSTVFGLRHHGKFLIKSTTASACTYYWNLPIKYKLKYLPHLCELFPR